MSTPRASDIGPPPPAPVLINKHRVVQFQLVTDLGGHTMIVALDTTGGLHMAVMRGSGMVGQWEKISGPLDPLP